MNKNIFIRDFSIYFLKSFSSKIFYKILREKESYMVKVGKQDTFKKYYLLNNMKNEIK